MFRLLFSCCIRPRDEDDPTVIPTETTHLISPSAGLSSPGLPEAIAVDHQKLHDRMGTIVRSKEGKMVNVGARTPFTLQSAPAESASAPPSSPTTPTSSANPPLPGTLVGRRPPVLTMTPARARLHADSRYSSPTGSRSSSRRRAGTDHSDRYTAYVHSPAERTKQLPVPNEWFGETESESSFSVSVGEAGPEEATSPLSGVPIATPVSNGKREEDNDASTMAIAFSWGDT
ncbi:hypothetical protein B0H19DRAFT_1277635 [Mycena capillaripes]|nr:hypothetical protein B0H19DRAFT_1277635 [Mycena capillaripes]